jgi:hypothetical protein
MSPHQSRPCGNAVEIAQILGLLQDGFNNSIILLRRLKDSLAASGHNAAAVTDVCKYEQDIAAIFQEAGRRQTSQPIYEGLRSRGHRCAKRTVQRYLKKMLRSGRIDHNACGYGLIINPPQSRSRPQSE